MKPSISFEEGQIKRLGNAEYAALYLEESLNNNDIDAFKLALRNVATARLGGMAELSESTQLNREALYRTLSRDGNPRLDTLTNVLGALGLRMSVNVCLPDKHI